MRKVNLVILGVFCVCVLGCSIPMTAKYSQLNAFSSGKAPKKGKISIFTPAHQPENFLGDKVSKENVEAAKERVEKYILAHSDLDEASKKYLRDLRVVRGASMEEVRLMLGEPAKIIKSGKKTRPSLETWVYKANKSVHFKVLIVSVFPTKETYYLYFKENILTGIKKHYLKQAAASSTRGGE